jgi:uncharacterized protein (TIGR03435 family)
LDSSEGKYSFEISFVEEVPAEVLERASKTGNPIDVHPSIFESLEKQLSLRLESQKGLVESIFVDHAEKPVSDN